MRERSRSGRVRYRWAKKRERNEALDCRVYALGALYVVASQVCEDQLGLDGIEWSKFWDFVERWAEARQVGDRQ